MQYEPAVIRFNRIMKLTAGKLLQSCETTDHVMPFNQSQGISHTFKACLLALVDDDQYFADHHSI